MTPTTVPPCPKCGDIRNRTQVRFTFWGGAIGPALVNHTLCNSCRTTFNGKTGKSNKNIIRYGFLLPTIIGLLVVVALAIYHVSH